MYSTVPPTRNMTPIMVPSFAVRGVSAKELQQLLPSGATYIKISSSRSGKLFNNLNKFTLHHDDRTYVRPIGPQRERVSKFDVNRWLTNKMLRRWRQDPWGFLAKFGKIILNFVPRLAQHPLTARANFAQICCAVWHKIRPRPSPIRVNHAPPPPQNRFTVLEHYTLPEWEENPFDLEFIQEDLVTPPSRPRVKKEKPLPEWDYSHPLFKAPKIRGRSSKLLLELKFKIKLLRLARLAKRQRIPLQERLFLNIISKPFPERLNNTWCRTPKTARNQMPMEDAHATASDADQVMEKAGNVCMVDQRDCSEASIPIVVVPPTISMGEQHHEFDTLVNRWIPLETFEWKSEPQNTLLKSYSLPSALLDLRGDASNVAVFNNFTYCRPEHMHFKVLVNANKFQRGQLQVSWLYDTLADRNIALRQHVCTLSQTMHALINAGSNNTACLKIPYISPYTHLPIVKSSDEDGDVCLHLGTVYIYVLNQLLTSSASNNKCSVTVYVKFEGCAFGGMRDKTLSKYVKPQMETAAALVAVGAAERLLFNNGGHNQDNPSYVSARSPMVPQAAQSFAHGTGAVEITNSLRLDPRGITQHFSVNDELSVRNIVSHYGFIKTHEWKTGHLTETLLFSYDASPMFDASEYHKTQVKSNYCYYIPPIAVVSSLFAQWRGCLKMRLDFIKNQFYTGRLLVAYITRVTGQPTYKQALAAPNMVFDLEESDTIEYEVPYITNRFAWPRRQGGVRTADRAPPPGRLYVFVMNPLVIMDSVPDTIDINVYWGGSTSFEVGIPAQPSIGTIFWTTDDTSDLEVKAAGGYYPWYWGFYGEFYGGKKAIARYGAGWQHVAQFWNADPTKYYTMNAAYVKQFPKLKKYDGTVIQPQYFVPLDLGDGLAWRYMGAVETLDKAQAYAKAPKDKKPTENVIDIDLTDDGAYCDGNPVFDSHDVSVRSSDSDSSIGSDFVKLGINQIDERDVDRTKFACDVLPCPAPSQGVRIWGESFTSLKDLCRRYQPYAVWGGKTNEIIGDTAFSFPVLPQGLDLEIDKWEKAKQYYQKYIREGTIPIVLSGFKFYRGSIRYQLIITPQQDVNIWVQHRPEIMSTQWVVQTADGPPRSSDRFINTGYAMTIQTTKVNNVVSFEIPFYVPYYAVQLQRVDIAKPHAQRTSSLGTVYVGVEGVKDKPIKIAVFYALGDDAQAEVFQGFPPMLLLDSLPEPKSASNQWGWPTVTVKHEHQLPKELQWNGEGGLKEQFKGVVDNTKLDNTIEWLTSLAGRFGENMKDMIISIITELGHVIMHPTVRSIVWAIVSLLLKLGIITGKFIGTLTAAFSRFLKYLALEFGDSDQTDKPGEGPSVKVARNQASVDESEEAISIVSVAFAAVSQVVGIVCHPPRCARDYALVFTRDLSKSVRSGSFIQTFLKNNLALFQKITAYISCKLHKNKLFERLVEEELCPLVEWCEEAELLLDPKHDERTFAQDSAWAERLEYCYVIGGKLQLHFLDYTKIKTGIRSAYSTFNQLYQRVIKKRENMLKRGYGAVARREPFCIWMSGLPGVGKSTCIQSMIPYLLQREGISYVGEPVFTLSSGMAYWNGCRQQPAMLIDDFLNVQSGELRDVAIRDFWSVKSPTVLNPPQAALEDKEARYCPELLFIASNHEFPKLTQVDDVAIWRRREFLVRASLRKEVADKLTNLNEDVSKVRQVMTDLGYDMASYEHLEFQFAIDPSQHDTMWSGKLNYHQMREEAYRRFHAYRDNQLCLYKRKMQAYEDNMRSDTDENFSESLSEKRDRFRRLALFIRAAEPAKGYSFGDFMKLANQYVNGEISTEALKTMEQIKVNCLALNNASRNRPKTKDALNQSPLAAAVTYRVSDAPDLIPEAFPDDHYTDIVKNEFGVDLKCPTMHQLDKGLLMAVIVEHLNTQDFLIRDSVEINKPKAEESGSTYKCLEILQYKILVTIICGYIYTICATCKWHTPSCVCKDKFEMWGKLPYVDRVIIKTTTKLALCPHANFDPEMYYAPDTKDDVTPGSFSTGEPNCEIIPEQYCEGVDLCRWNPSNADNTLVKDMEEWAKNFPQIISSRDTICAPMYYRNLWKGVDEKATKLGVSTTSAVATSIVEDLKKNEVIPSTPPKESWLERNIAPALRKFWSFLKLCAPFIAVVGLLVGGGLLLSRAGGFFTSAGEHLSNPFEPTAVAYDVTKGVTTVAAAGAGVGVGAAGLGAALIDNTKGRRTDGAIPIGSYVERTINQIHASGDSKGIKNVSRSAKPAPYKFAGNQSPNFNAHQTHVLERITKNTYFMYYVRRGQMSPAIRVVVAYENYIIMPWHYWVTIQLDKAETLILKSPVNKDFSLTVSVNGLKPEQAAQRDLCLMRIISLTNHRSLVKFMADESGHERPRGMCAIAEVTPAGVMLITPVTPQRDVVTVTGSYNATLNDVYSYRFTGNGKCGSLLINPNSNRPILGMHVAGAAIEGFSEPLVAESFSPLVDVDDSVGIDEIPLYDDRLDGTYLPFGVAAEGMGHNQSGESQIVPSLVHGIFPVVTQPAPLAQGDQRVDVKNYSPLWEGCMNMTRPVVEYDTKYLIPCAEAFTSRLIARCKPVREKVGLLNISDVIVGIPELKYYDGIDMHTSEGFPLSRYRPPGACNKSWLFKLEGNPVQYKGMHKYLVDIYTYKMAKRANNIIPLTVFDDCLKDARIPAEKCKIRGKTRIFSTSPVDYTIAIKQYFGDFQAAYKTARLNLSHAIGINPEGPEWASLVRYLTKKGQTKFVTGDYSNFGPSLKHNVLWAVAKAIIAWYEHYGDKHPGFAAQQNIRYILMCETIEAYHMTHIYVWQALAGLPSGCPLTVELNSGVNEMYVTMAWYEIMEGINLRWMCLDQFYFHCSLVTYGDDLIMSVSDEVIEHFNNLTLSKLFSKYSIKFTDASKAGNKAYETSLADCTFLKRSFLPHPYFPNQYLAPLDEEVSVKDVANWVRKSQDMLAATEESILASALNAYSLGPEKFQLIKNRLQEALFGINSTLIIRSWDEIDRLRFPDMYGKF